MPSDSASYSDCPPRIAKDDLFMVLALWMEHFPVKGEAKGNEDHHKVGAVLVLPNDTLCAVDCTRDGVHGVARLLMNHPDIAKGCKIFVSRKPCSICTKLLVQSKVERVFFPPFEPEYHGVSISETFESETSQVDTLFTRSSIGQTVFVPKVDDAVLEHEKKKLLLYTNGIVSSKKDELFRKFWKDGWMETKNVATNLPWKAFDGKMEKHIKSDFTNTMEWMAIILINSGLHTDVNISFPNVKTTKPDNGSSTSFVLLFSLLLWFLSLLTNTY